MDDLIRHPMAYARIERGWSLEDLARRVRHAALRRGLRSGVDRQRIWKWENGRAEPDSHSQLLLAAAFDVDESLVDSLGWPSWLPGRDGPISLGPHSTVPALREALRTSMDRRAFLTYSTAALAGLAHEWATTEPQALAAALDGKQVDAELVETLEITSDRLTSLVTEQRQHTSKLLRAHLDTVTDLIEQGNYAHPVELRLHTLAARLSQTIGWHRFDQGRHTSAGHYWHAALHNAHASGDRDLGAGILSDFAYQATWLKNPKDAADILQSALHRTRHPAARSLLSLRLARAQAALGDARACRGSLSSTERELGAVAGEPSSAWCTWMSPADLLVDSGQWLLDLGESQRAHRLIANGRDLLPRARTKTRAVFLTYEAGSYLRAGEVDQAAAAAKESLALAARIGAPRCITLVRDLLPDFMKHAAAEGVSELLHLAKAT
ncbi:helix-turn-helix transcriptional regulator [Streptomyces inhibens]|uniref:helix-turn-helix transcriptional regulator n=1 Tax=Streptomyces inhibens TaxID=2293571 RepID=UPI00402AFD5A